MQGFWKLRINSYLPILPLIYHHLQLISAALGYQSAQCVVGITMRVGHSTVNGPSIPTILMMPSAGHFPYRQMRLPAPRLTLPLPIALIEYLLR